MQTSMKQLPGSPKSRSASGCSDILGEVIVNLMDIDRIIGELRSLPGTQRPVFIAIDGFGGSGKSTLAAKLRTTLVSAFVINIDDFITKERVFDLSGEKSSFDRNRLKQQVLLPGSRGEQVRYQRLIWESNSLSEPIVVPDVDFLIVEGISSYHPDIASFYNLKIWIETPIEMAKERGRARDAGNENAQHWDRWAENDLLYQQKFHPELAADFVMSGV